MNVPGSVSLRLVTLVTRVPSVWELSTASRRTYMATKRSGSGSVRATPSRWPTAWSAHESGDYTAPSMSTGGLGGRGAGTKAVYPDSCFTNRPAR